ncbi:MAG: hypothetical protein ACLVKO_07380 [Dysgonomonas sp.]
MLFIPLLIIGIALYFTDKRVLSVLIFFFFLTDGFQLFPLALFDTGLIVSKPLDFALLYILIIFCIGVFFYKDFFPKPKDKLLIGICIFLLFVLISIGINKYIYHVAWGEIFRTSRNYLFVLVYFIFRRLTKDDVLKILNVLFYITLFLCTIYIIQSIVGRPLLTGASGNGSFGKINRYYNIPKLYYFFIFYVFFSGLVKKKYKAFSMTIFILVTIVSLHRNLLIAVLVLSFWGIYIQKGGLKGVFKYLLIGCICMLPVINILTDRFSNKTSDDISNVMEGAFKEAERGDVILDGTFMFRMALFYERFEYVVEHPLNILFGVGFMAEDSPMTYNMFDFKIGLLNNENEVVQLDTSDIAWINFMLRLGLLGTVLYLYLYYVLAAYSYKHRKDSLMLISLLYIFLLLITSVASSILYYTEMIVPCIMVYLYKKRQEAPIIQNE